MLPSISLTYHPSPEQVERIIDDLADPGLTLRDLAQIHNTTVHQLTLLLARPDIAERLALVESTAIKRARITAANYLPAAAAAIHQALEALDLHNLPKDQETRRRTLETARRAATLLLRIARHQSPSPNQGATTRRPPSSPPSPPLPPPPPPAGSADRRLTTPPPADTSRAAPASGLVAVAPDDTIPPPRTQARILQLITSAGLTTTPTRTSQPKACRRGPSAYDPIPALGKPP